MTLVQEKSESVKTARAGGLARALGCVGDEPVSPVVIFGFIAGQKKTWELTYFLLSEGVQCHLECNLYYQKYGMLRVKTIYIYKYIYTYLFTRVHITAQIGRVHAFYAVRYNGKRVLNLSKQDASRRLY